MQFVQHKASVKKKKKNRSILDTFQRLQRQNMTQLMRANCMHL